MQVTAFYDAHPISEAQILRALRRAGHDPERLRPEDLYAHDQDHYGGVDATIALAERAGVTAGSRVLDVCAGMGGPARLIAHRLGADVTGVDLTESRVVGANRLTRRVGLQDRVRFVGGDATRLPLADQCFDVALSQEAFLHIPDKRALLSECFRVVRPGGRLGFTDLVARAPLAPAARAALEEGIACRSLLAPDAYVASLREAGFARVEHDDLSAAWAPILEARLAMYERLADEAKQDLGEDRHRRYVELYRVFVAEVAAGRLGGGRFIAHRAT